MATFNTTRLKELVGYAIQGAGFMKDLEMSNYIGIKAKDGMLSLNTTDGTNYLRVTDSCVSGDFDIAVDADLFARLIGKLNSDTVDMAIVDGNLVIKGNGKYTLGIKPDENGGVLTFPDKFPTDAEKIGEMSAIDIAMVATSVKASLSPVVGSIYSAYYFGDIVASTDKAMMGAYNKKIFDTPYLVNRKVIDVLASTTSDVTVSKSGTMLVFTSEITEKCSVSICTVIDERVSEYNVAGINKFTNLEVTSFCRFKKSQMLDLLDRLILFVSKFDDGAIELRFNENYIEVASLASDGVERVEVTEFKDAKDMAVKINIERFRNQLRAYNSDTVDLHYGSDICIKLTDGDLTQVIALIK